MRGERWVRVQEFIYKGRTRISENVLLEDFIYRRAPGLKNYWNGKNTHTYIHTHSKAGRLTDRQPERQTDRQTERKTTKKTDRQIDRQPDRQTNSIGGGQIHQRISTVTIKKIERK